MWRRRNGLVLCIAAAFLVACGGGGSDGVDEADEPPGETDGSVEEASLTDAGAKIVALVSTRGGRLDLTATQFFSDVDITELEAGAVGGLDIVAPTRARIGERLSRSATEAAEDLSALAEDASTTTEKVVQLASAAFDALADCGTEAAAAWTSVVEGEVDVPAMRQADRTCKAARAAYAKAESAIEDLPDAPTESTTEEAAGAGEELRVVVGTSSGTQPNEVVQPVAPGAKVSIVLDARNTSSFRWRLEKQCDGPLTLDVTLLISSEGTLAIDPAEAGYSASDTPTRQKVSASIKGSERFELAIGTFTIADDASGSTRIVVTLANNRCPDPQTGAAFSPIAVGPSLSDALVLEVS